MPTYQGACLCGAIHYELSADPVTVRVCWCRDCQRIASNGTVNALFPTAALQVTGAPAEFVRVADSGNEIRHRFCPTCGTQLFGNSTARPQFTVVRVGTLADPSSFAPLVNIWSVSAPAWACMDDALQKSERQPPPPPQIVMPPSAA